ncbi:MAG: tRNA (adenosine(37)-N6)-threonylcarbamoyltransferase complex ATPase subunit type 1 TsaE [Patescibacteria group bacterium]
MTNSKDIFNTREVAEDLASRLPCRIFALIGDLGAGKTTFSQFFLRALKVKGRITSPTFTIIKNYKLNSPIGGQNYASAYHIDCYRIKNPEELLALGFKEILDNPKNILLIEWADKIKELLPKSALWIEFEHGKDKNERNIIID